MERSLQAIDDEIISGNRGGVEAGVQAALRAGLPVASILNEGLMATMKEVGDRFERHEFYVPEALVAARAMQSGLTLLKPHLI